MGLFDWSNLMEVETLLSLALSAISLGAVLWRAGSETERIKASIKDVRDELSYRYDLELERLKASIEKQEYISHSNRELINHKATRFEAEIAALKGYLQRYGFRERKQRIDDEDGGPVTGPL